MPLIGMGTRASPLPPPDILTSILIDTIEVGYRHFDTATLYGSEESLGRAVAEALERGLIKSHNEMFITTKLWCIDAHHDLVLPALNLSLKRLGLEYVDLYLIHGPVRLKQGVYTFKFTEDDILPLDIKGTWEAMEECSKLGLAKSIGVSNYGTKKLTELFQHATIPPAVNQVEMNASWQQQKMVEFCKEKGLHVSAWSPLGANGAFWGSLAVMESPILKEITVTRWQVALRWIHEQGASAIVKSFNRERMTENLQIFSWELSKDEQEKIKQIPQSKGFSIEKNVSKDKPFKSIDELSDSDA